MYVDVLFLLSCRVTGLSFLVTCHNNRHQVFCPTGVAGIIYVAYGLPQGDYKILELDTSTTKFHSLRTYDTGISVRQETPSICYAPAPHNLVIVCYNRPAKMIRALPVKSDEKETKEDEEKENKHDIFTEVQTEIDVSVANEKKGKTGEAENKQVVNGPDAPRGAIKAPLAESEKDLDVDGADKIEQKPSCGRQDSQLGHQGKAK